MDSSPLIKAHDHAHAAQTTDTTVAISEHILAAGEFANASKITTCAEALRTLALLEQYHKQAAELLKFPSEQPISQPSSTDSDISEADHNVDPTDHGDSNKPTKSRGPEPPSMLTPSTAAKPVPTLPTPRGPPKRDLTSSIASNLAQARGIRSKYRTQALTPSVSNDQAPGSLEVHPRREGSHRSSRANGNPPGQSPQLPSWVPPTQHHGTKLETEAPKSEQQTSTAQNDGAYSMFYGRFSGWINRLSAPLAFAGLPLISEESSIEATSPNTGGQSAESSHKRSRSQQKSSTSPSPADPDLSKIFSPATLRTLARDGHHHSRTSDSFYVVPPSGHTASYASILNHENKERRRLAASMHLDDPDGGEDDDDFVDARESQPPLPILSPGLRKRLGISSSGSKGQRELQNAMEELHLENANLKEMLDKVTKRLHAFELNSQQSTLALQQSLRFQRPGSPMSASIGGGGAASSEEAALKRRVRELEEQLKATRQHMAVLEKEYDKLEETVEKYRQRWEQLKAGAKARRERVTQGQQQGDGQQDQEQDPPIVENEASK